MNPILSCSFLERLLPGGRVSILPSIGHIPPGSPPTLLSVFEKPILIFLNFSNGHGGSARITGGRKITPKSGYEGGNAVILPGHGARRSQRCFGLTGRRQRIPSFVGEAQGIEPIGGIGGESELNVRGVVGIVLVQTDFGA